MDGIARRRESDDEEPRPPQPSSSPGAPTNADARLAAIARLRRAAKEPFGGARLTLDLVPATAWGANLRTALRPGDWDRVRRAAYRRASWTCEVCGGRGTAHPVECHEVWRYRDAAGDQSVQRLAGLVALCPACHEVKHFGRAEVQGRGDAAFAHLMAVNGWNAAQADAYVALAFDVWELRSQVPWKLDVRWLEAVGVPVHDITVPNTPAPAIDGA